MAVRIRMKRLGRRHRPFFRICVMDSREARDGKAVEELGYYDPMVHDKSQRVKLDMERVDHWLSVGAKPSENVAALIKKVKTNRFGTAAAPPPLTPPKQPEKPAEEPAEEPAAETAAETAEAPAEEAEQKPAEQSAEPSSEAETKDES